MLYICKYFGLLGIAIFLIRAFAERILYKGTKKEVRKLLIASLVMVIIFLVGHIGLIVINSCYFEETVQTEEYTFLYIENDKIHYRNSKKNLMKKDINDNKVEIIENSNYAMTMVEYTTYTKNRFNSNWRLILTLDAFDQIEKHYVVYVPEGYLKDMQ